MYSRKHCREMPTRCAAGPRAVDKPAGTCRKQQQLAMRRAPLPLHLTTGSFSLRAADKAGVTRTRTAARDLMTVSRGIRVPADSAAAGAAALRAYTDLDDDSILSFGSSARLWNAPLPVWLEEDWRIHLARRRGRSTPRRVNVVGHQLALLPDEVVEFDGVRLTSPARTWLDLAAVLSTDDLVIAGDSLVCEHGQEFPVPRERLVQYRGIAVHGGAASGQPRRAEGAGRRSTSSGWGPIRHPKRGCAWPSSASGLPEPELNYVLGECMAFRCCGRMRPTRGLARLHPVRRRRPWRLGQYLRDIRRESVQRAYGWLEVRVVPSRPRCGRSRRRAQSPCRAGEPGLAREMTVRGSASVEYCREVPPRAGVARSVTGAE